MKIVVQGVPMSPAAAQCVIETGTRVNADVEIVRWNMWTLDQLLEYCTENADIDRWKGWEEYVDAVEAEVARRNAN